MKGTLTRDERKEVALFPLATKEKTEQREVTEQETARRKETSLNGSLSGCTERDADVR